MNVEKSLKYVFHVLSRCPKGAASSARIHIPDTLFYEHGTLQFWYRYDPDTHEIVRKDRRECSTDMIYEALGLEGRGVDASLRASAVATMLAGGYNVNFPDVPVAVLLSSRFVVPGFAPGDPRKDPDNHRLRREARRRARAGQSAIRKHAVPLDLVDDDDASSVDSDDSRGGVSQPKQVIAETFLDRPGIDAFLNGNDLKHHSLLQKYPLGRSLHASTVEAVYSPQVIHITQRQNKRFLSDTSVSLYERCVTNESCPHLVEPIQISPHAKELVEADCRAIAEHILAVENRCVARMVCYFSFETCEDMPDEPGGIKPLLLWVSELHLSKEIPKEQVRRTIASFTDRKLMQMQPETIPGLFIGPGQKKKRQEYLRDKEKYLPYAAKVGSPLVDEGRGGTDRILSSLKDRQYEKLCHTMEQFRTSKARQTFHGIRKRFQEGHSSSHYGEHNNSHSLTSFHGSTSNTSQLLSPNTDNESPSSATTKQHLEWSNSPFAHLINKLEQEKLDKMNKSKRSTEDQIKELILRASSSASGKRSLLAPMTQQQQSPAVSRTAASTPPPRYSPHQKNQNNNNNNNGLPSHIKTQSQLELHFLAKGSRNLLTPMSELVKKSGKKGLLEGDDNPSSIQQHHESSFHSSNNNNQGPFSSVTNDSLSGSPFSHSQNNNSNTRLNSPFSSANASPRKDSDLGSTRSPHSQHGHSPRSSSHGHSPRSAYSSPGSNLGSGAGGPLSASNRPGGSSIISGAKNRKSKAQMLRDQMQRAQNEKDRAKAEADLKFAIEAAKSAASKSQLQDLEKIVGRERTASIGEESQGGSESLENTISNLNHTMSSLSSVLPSHKRRRFLDNEPPPIDSELFCTLSSKKLLQKSKQLCNAPNSPNWMKCLSPDVNLYLHHQLSALDAAYEWCSHMAYCFENAAKQAEDDQRAELAAFQTAGNSNPFKEKPDVEVRVEVAPFPPPASRRLCPLTLQEIVVPPPKIYLFTAWKMILFPGPQDEGGSARGGGVSGDAAAGGAAPSTKDGKNNTNSTVTSNPTKREQSSFVSVNDGMAPLLSPASREARRNRMNNNTNSPSGNSHVVVDGAPFVKSPPTSPQLRQQTASEHHQQQKPQPLQLSEAQLGNLIGTGFANQHGHVGAQDSGRIGPLPSALRRKRSFTGSNSNPNTPRHGDTHHEGEYSATSGRKRSNSVGGDNAMGKPSSLDSTRPNSALVSGRGETSGSSTMSSPSRNSLAGGVTGLLSTGDDRNYAAINKRKIAQRQQQEKDSQRFHQDGEEHDEPIINQIADDQQQQHRPDFILPDDEDGNNDLHSPKIGETSMTVTAKSSTTGFGDSIFGEQAGDIVSGGSNNGRESSPNSFFGDSGNNNHSVTSTRRMSLSGGGLNTFSPTRTRGRSGSRVRNNIARSIPGYKPLSGYLIRQQPLSEDSYVVPYRIESGTILSNLGSATGKELISVSSNIDAWTLVGVDDTKVTVGGDHQQQQQHQSNNKNNKKNNNSSGGYNNSNNTSSSTSGGSRLLDTPVMSLSAAQMLSTQYVIKKFPVFNPRSNNFVVPLPANSIARVTCESIKDCHAKAEAFKELARIAMTTRRFVLFETIGIALRKAATFSKKMHLSAITAEAQLSGTVLVSQKEGKRGSAFMAGAVKLFREDSRARAQNEKYQAEEDAKRKEKESNNIHNDPGRVIRRFFSEVPCALSAPATWGEDLKTLQMRFSGSEANDKADRLALEKARDVHIPAQPSEVSPIAKQLQVACEHFTMDLKMELMRMLRVACLPSYLAEVPPDVSEELLLLDTTSRMRRPSNRSRMTPDQQQNMFNEAMRQLQVEHDTIAHRKQNPALQPVDAAVEDWPPKLVLRPDVIPEGLC